MTTFWGPDFDALPATDPAIGGAVTGRDAEERCDAAGITLNKNAIPYDPQRPMTASGIRVGLPEILDDLGRHGTGDHPRSTEIRRRGHGGGGGGRRA